MFRIGTAIYTLPRIARPLLAIAARLPLHSRRRYLAYTALTKIAHRD